MKHPRRLVLAVLALILIIPPACDEFGVEPVVPSGVVIRPVSWPDTVLLSGWAEYQVTLIDAEGDTILGAPISWEGDGLRVDGGPDYRVAVEGLLVGDRELRASVGGLLTGDPYSAGVTVAFGGLSLVPSVDTIVVDALRDTVVLRVVAHDAAGNPRPSGAGVQWEYGAGVLSVASQAGDSLRLVAVGPGIQSGAVTLSPCMGPCRAEFAVAVRQRTALLSIGELPDVLVAGERVTPVVEAHDRNGNVIQGVEAARESSDSAVARWTEAGEVEGRQAGTATLTVRADEVSTQRVVTVVAGAPVRIEAHADTVRFSTVSSSAVVAVEAWDSLGNLIPDPGLAWSSTDALVAAVDAAGRITAAGAGSADIGVEVTNRAACELECDRVIHVIVDPLAAAVAVGLEPDTVEAGATITATAEARDSAGYAIAGASYVWASSDTMVARVDAGGVVLGIAPGSAEITAASGAVQGTAAVHVIQASVATLVLSPDTVRFSALDDTTTLGIELKDAAGNPASASVSWTSTDTMTVAVEGGLLTARGAGTALIRALAGSGRDSAVVEVVQVPAAVAIAVDSIEVRKDSSVTLLAEVTDANGYPAVGVTTAWASGDTAIATVAEGVLTGRAPGSTWVTAGVPGTALEDSVWVRVVNPGVVATLNLSPDTIRLKALEDTASFDAVLLDSEGSAVSATIEWLSEDTLVAVVTRGQVTARAAGSTRVIAVAGSVTDTAAVEVTQAPAALLMAPASLDLEPDSTGVLVATVLDSNGHTIPGVPLDWSSTDTLVAAVSEGLVTGRSPGEAWIRSIEPGTALADSALVSVGEFGAVRLALADAPGAWLDSAMVWVSAAALRGPTPDTATQALSAAGGWYDLLRLSGGVVADLAAGRVPTGRYDSLELTIDSVVAVLKPGYTFSDGSSRRSSAGPGPVVAGIDTAGAVSAADTLVLVVDFDVNQSFLLPGTPPHDLELELVPHLTALGRAESGVLRGTVTATAGDSALLEGLPVTAVRQRDGDTLRLMSLSSGGGAYAFHHAPPGTYELSVQAPTCHVSGPAVTVTLAAGAEALASALALAAEDIASVTIASSVDTLNALGDTLSPSVRVIDSAGNDVASQITWSSSAPTIASVSAGGEVVALGPGEAQVVAAACGVADTLALHVRQVPASLDVTPTSLDLTVGSEAALQAVVSDSNAVAISGAVVTWSVGDTTIAAVDTAGLVRGLASGETVVYGAHGDVRASSAVLVRSGATIATGVESFETGVGDWIASAVGDVAHGRSADRSVTGAYAYRMGRSSCESNCYGAAERIVRLSLPVHGAFIDSLRFSVLEESDRTSNFGQSGWVEADGTVVAGSSFDPHLRVGREVWQERVVAVGMYVDTLRLVGQDLTSSGSLFVDDLEVFPGVGVGSVAIEQGDTSVLIDEPLRLTAAVFDTVGNRLSGRLVQWLSADTLVARIDSAGTVTGIRAGTVSIVARLEGTADTITATVGAVTQHDSFVAAGGAHACALTAAGEVLCWGDASYGQLGTGDYVSRSVPTLVATPEPLTSITAGDRHTCGLTLEGAAYCWGQNTNGELGDGSTQTRSLPSLVSSAERFISIEAGSYHTCGITEQQEAYCWGFGGNGERGDGTSTYQVVSPTRVAGNHAFTRLDAAAANTCAVTTSGALYCWGNGIGTAPVLQPEAPSGAAWAGPVVSANWESLCGVTGGGTVYCWNTQDQVVRPAGSPYRYATVDASNHSCGIDLEGVAHCWPGSQGGALGDGSFSMDSRVSTVGEGLQFSSIATGGTDFSCGIAVDGVLYCWGHRGAGGSLGDDQTAFRYDAGRISGYSFLEIAAGEGQTCAVDGTGQPYCWGQIHSPYYRSVPYRLEPTAIGSGLALADIAVNPSTYYPHACGLTAGGDAYCWGSGQQGQIGDGQWYDVSETPRAVTGGHAFKELSLGYELTCGVTLTGDAYCWGGGWDGQLGTGNTNSSSVPALVVGSHSFTAISAGDMHVCALDTAGQVYCWGRNYSGELGLGTTTEGPREPTLAAGGMTFSAVAARGNSTCALTTAGAAYCWGERYGVTPVRIESSVAFAAISLGKGHACGLADTGEAYCWGQGSSGQLGNGSSESSAVPVLVHAGQRFTGISAGANHTCATDAYSQTFCWGDRYRGQLGDGTMAASPYPVPSVGAVLYRTGR